MEHEIEMLAIMGQINENLEKMNGLLEKIERQASSIDSNSGYIRNIKSETSDINSNLEALINLTKNK